jgi:hypothetical protein
MCKYLYLNLAHQLIQNKFNKRESLLSLCLNNLIVSYYNYEQCQSKNNSLPGPWNVNEGDKD